jgi:hypothetical protein
MSRIRTVTSWMRLVPSLAAACFCGASLAAQAPPASPPTPAASPPPAAQPAPGAPPAAGTQAPAAPPAAETPATPPPARLDFATPAGAFLATIKPDKAGDFEALLAMYGEALAKSADPERQKQAASVRVYKVGEPAPGGVNVLYLVLIDPVASGADYSWRAILTSLYEAFPDKAQEIFAKGSTVHAAPMNKLSLTALK